MARKWEQIIPYEDRSDELTTTNWRLSGFNTHASHLNNDGGVVWLSTVKTGNNVVCTLYQDDALANSIALAPSVDVSGLDNTGDNDVTVTFAEQNDSGITGTMLIRNYEAEATVPVLVALCVDEDMRVLFSDLETLDAFDETTGMGDTIRVAHGDVLVRVMAMFMDELGGHGAQEAWFITDADRTLPDLRKVASPQQLRQICAYRALDLAFRRDHERADDTMYSQLADHWAQQYEERIGGLRLAIKPGSGDNAETSPSASTVRLKRA